MSKQPLEGLTVRIFDPPANDTQKKTGSRGYREYTEIQGTDRLRNTNYNWSSNQTITREGFQPSNRDWGTDTQNRRGENVQDLSLVSRSDGNDKKSLRNVKLQHELWSHIQVKLAEIDGVQDKKKWEAVVDLFRKLREGVFSSQWSRGDFKFANQVYEASIDTCIKASNHEELVKSLAGLMQLYELQHYTRAKTYYTTLDIVYECCYNQNLIKATQRITCLKTDTDEYDFAKQLTKSISSENSLLYFQLYHRNPYLSFQLLMDYYADRMRIKAIARLRKAYLSASISWVGKWLGIYHDNNVVLSEMARLVKPSCIKSVDYERQLVYFSKR
ncbi:unnamed protein product [Mucor circinelloides]|uniref:PCI domain-containing protein n=1 Tax=Mucor circinelloides f. circinelloides (strain 1006PhL) TaxID=1220926 RepID=S2K5V7_MUCC1|nr:hypothetical protein HMPREF1544_02356 [Mucor circinelloides 1006PhL]KAG1121622.1 hypothetical protein G6F42_012251 [Rhizopus arrhizus]